MSDQAGSSGNRDLSQNTVSPSEKEVILQQHLQLLRRIVDLYERNHDIRRKHQLEGNNMTAQAIKNLLLIPRLEFVATQLDEENTRFEAENSPSVGPYSNADI